MSSRTISRNWIHTKPISGGNALRMFYSSTCQYSCVRICTYLYKPIVLVWFKWDNKVSATCYPDAFLIQLFMYEYKSVYRWMLLCTLYPDTSYTWPVPVTDFNFKWCYDCRTTPTVSFDIAKSMQLNVCQATVLKISFDSEKELSLNKFVCHVKADGRIR